ncbi:hypothetical protein FG386_000989 [Cryptosporidium ryanae]|uniref:uncharacterized protein n=1 Tax=Cryptosporidium ryanae TaxID=515981 RepID=UPI00351A999E|nr:hypothetical protein FG386_000989 [Cryptosporidium ryanae]
MNDFEILRKHLEISRDLIRQVESLEKTCSDNACERSFIERNLETSVNLSGGETNEEVCKATNCLYLVSQKKLVNEIVSGLQPEKVVALIKRMINTPPIGSNFEKMVENRRIWIDELSWYLTIKKNDKGRQRDADTSDYSDIVEAFDNYGNYFDLSLNLKGIVDLSLGVISNDI